MSLKKYLNIEFVESKKLQDIYSANFMPGFKCLA